MKKVEADVAIVKNVNEKLVNQLIETELQCWANAQYSRRECLEVVWIPASIPNDWLDANISEVFDKLGVHVKGNDIQACHCLKDNDRVVIKFSNRKDSLQGSLCQKRPQIFGPHWIRLSWVHENIYNWKSLCLLLWSVEHM